MGKSVHRIGHSRVYVSRCTVQRVESLMERVAYHVFIILNVDMLMYFERSHPVVYRQIYNILVPSEHLVYACVVF